MTLIKNSEGGYVLYEKKPICINGFQNLDDFYGENESHRDCVYLKEAVDVWKKIKDLANNENLTIHIYDKPDLLAKNYIHILVINKRLFHQVVTDNLVLFKSILGPEINSEKLLSLLTDPEHTFHESLKNNKILIGILLGFGTQNALYGSRLEELEEIFLSPESPPFVNPLYQEKKILREYPLNKLSTVGHVSTKSLDLFKKEFREIFQKMEVSSSQLASERPYFIFGRLKGDESTNRAVQELEETQQKIQDLISKTDFLNQMLTIFFGENSIKMMPYYEAKLLSFNEAELEELPRLIAASLWNKIKHEDESFIRGFFRSLNSPANVVIEQKNYDYEKIKQLKIAFDHLRDADAIFAHLKKNSTFRSLCSGKIFYQVLCKGTGALLKDHCKVILNYKINLPDNTLIVDTWYHGKAEEVDLRDTILGFSCGIHGMRVGEIREIYIHPSLAYGIYTSLPKGIYLKIRVELKDIVANNEKNFEEPIPLDFKDELDEFKKLDYPQLSEEEGLAFGSQMYGHYSMGLNISRSTMLKLILEAKNNLNPIDLRSSKNQNMINRLHWNIYSKKE